MADNLNINAWSFEPVETKRAYEIVYDQLCDMILYGKLKPGDKLPSERQLMGVFNRSHPTIREAIRMLEQSGLIVVVPGGGSIISDVNSRSISEPFLQMLKQQDVSPLEIMEYMIACEAEYVGVAAQNRSDEDIDALEEYCIQNQNASSIDENDQIDVEFHRRLIALSGNQIAYVVVSTTHQLVTEKMAACARKMAPEEQAAFLAQSRRDHLQLVQDVRERNGEAARTHLISHTARAKEIFQLFYFHI